VGGGIIWGDGEVSPPNPRIEIYFDGDDTVNMAGKELIFPYDRAVAANHPETTRKITVRLIDGPAEFPKLVWQIRHRNALTNGMLTPSANWNPPLPTIWNQLADQLHASGDSFTITAGMVPGNARLMVQNASNAFPGDDSVLDGYGKPYGRYALGTLTAYIEISIGADSLPPIEIFVTETKRVRGIGFVKSDQGTYAPKWSSGLGLAAIVPNVYDAYSRGGYNGATLDITGLKEGLGTYAGGTIRGGKPAPYSPGLNNWSDNELRPWTGGSYGETTGALTVIAATTWYVRDGLINQGGEYGFTEADKVTLPNAMTNMNTWYYESGQAGKAVWPDKNTDRERHAGMKFTEDVPGNLDFSLSSFPKYIDLMNNASTGTVSIGYLTSDFGKTITMDGVRANGINIAAGSSLTMLSARTVVAGATALVAGTLTVKDGTVESSVFHVQSGGRVIMDAGTIGSAANVKVESGGEFTMTGGAYNGSTNVQTGGRLVIQAGTVIGPGSQVSWNGSPVSPWPPSLPYVLGP
jgi:hypothetical protein